MEQEREQDRHSPTCHSTSSSAVGSCVGEVPPGKEAQLHSIRSFFISATSDGSRKVPKTVEKEQPQNEKKERTHATSPMTGQGKAGLS